MDDETAFGAQVDRGIAQLLPVVGPASGALVLLFAAWDAWVDPVHARTTLAVRIGLVALGALAWFERPLRWPALPRCALFYVTHVAAMTISAALLDGGLLLAMPGLTGVLFPLALIEPRVRRCLALALAPALLFVALAAMRLPARLFLDCLLMYGLSLALACAVASVTGQFRRRAFQDEQALLRASRFDSLSGALARGYVSELAAHDVAVARRHRHPLAVAMLDIDHFKRVNDTHGHAAGDRVLAALAGACRGAMRASDYLGRIGGEEFVCVMPETGLADAIACAERIRLAIAAMGVPLAAGTLHVTVSVGVAALDGAGSDWTALLAAADAALYRAKASGRNRTVAAARTAPSGANSG